MKTIMLLLLVFGLSACGTVPGSWGPREWVHSGRAAVEPGEPVFVRDLSAHCPVGVIGGCWDGARMYVKLGLTPAAAAEVISHEKAHAAGWDHGPMQPTRNAAGIGLR